jgi:hypothetical protein
VFFFTTSNLVAIDFFSIYMWCYNAIFPVASRVATKIVFHLHVCFNFDFFLVTSRVATTFCNCVNFQLQPFFDLHMVL